MLIVCASVSGSPGVSTVAVGLAAGWPGRGAVLVEADPSGGVVAARFGLAQQPGLSSLAAAARHGGVVGSAAEHVQLLPIGVEAVVAPGSAAGAMEPSRVLLAMGLSRDEAECTIRFSLGYATTADDIDIAIRRVIDAERRVRAALCPNTNTTASGPTGGQEGPRRHDA